MALLANPVFQHPVMLRVRAFLQSRLVLGIGYGVAAGLTGLAILLAASPPASGPLGPLSFPYQARTAEASSCRRGVKPRAGTMWFLSCAR